MLCLHALLLSLEPCLAGLGLKISGAKFTSCDSVGALLGNLVSDLLSLDLLVGLDLLRLLAVLLEDGSTAFLLALFASSLSLLTAPLHSLQLLLAPLLLLIAALLPLPLALFLAPLLLLLHLLVVAPHVLAVLSTATLTLNLLLPLPF